MKMCYCKSRTKVVFYLVLLLYCQLRVVAICDEKIYGDLVQ